MSIKRGPILVIGGTGRLGFFIIQELLKQPECGDIVSINRHPNEENKHQGVDYRAIDLRDEEYLSRVIHEVRPETVFNTSAPSHIGIDSSSGKEFHETFVLAQDHLIALAREVGTKYLVHTSSISVSSGQEHIDIDETAPRQTSNAKAFPYAIHKAEGEKRLLAADSSSLQTVALRLSTIIGERDSNMIPIYLGMLERGETGIQIGDGTGKQSTISGEDAAQAHVLALRKLMEPGNNVHGEAFHISNKRALSFWTMAQVVWTAAGWKKEKEPFVIPEGVALILFGIIEWAYWIFTLGRRQPQFNRQVVNYMCNKFTYDGTKAKRRLGFVPKDNVEEQLRKGVEWHLKHAKKE